MSLGSSRGHGLAFNESGGNASKACPGAFKSGGRAWGHQKGEAVERRRGPGARGEEDGRGRPVADQIRCEEKINVLHLKSMETLSFIYDLSVTCLEDLERGPRFHYCTLFLKGCPDKLRNQGFHALPIGTLMKP